MRFVAGVVSLSFVLLTGALGAGCSEDHEPDFPDPDVAPADVNPDGVPYPTDRTGSAARANGRPGARVPNFSFQAYVDGDRGAGLRPISMADYFDPTEARHKVLVVVAAATWCSICAANAEAFVPKKEALAAEGVAYLEVIVNGARLNEGPSLGDVEAWMSRHDANYTTAIDVRARRMGSLGVSTVPWSMIVDTRSMEILEAGAGAPADMTKYARAGLAWVAANPPSY